MGRTAEPDRMRLKNEKISFQQYIWYLIQVRGIFFLVLFLAMGIRIRKIVAAFFLLWTGMSGGILLSEAVAELGMKGSILCVAVPFLCSGSSCAFALLLELSTESVEQTKNVLCMRFVFNWDFFRILS